MLYHHCLISLLLLLALFKSQAQEKAVIDSSYANNYYKQRLAFFRQVPDSKAEIIFLGNSITEAGEWQELVPGRPVKNRGISGDVTYGVLARLDEVLSSAPAKIFLLIGINDMKRGIPIDTIAGNCRRILEVMKRNSPATEVYIQSVLPVNEGMLGASYKQLKNSLILSLNQKLEAVAHKTKCTFVNLQEIMEDEKGQLSKELTTDGIHLWPSAYIRWVDYMKTKKYL